MRIISGRYRGLKLCEFDGKDIRPTADRVKESLFNILAEKTVGATVLDLFCGSGALGLECLSRGADFVCFNDNSPPSIAVLTKNLQKIPSKKNYMVSRLDYAQCLANSSTEYDVIFIDPPYGSDAGIASLGIIGRGGILKKNGVVIFERDRKFEGQIEGLTAVDERKYGKTYLTFFKGE